MRKLERILRHKDLTAVTADGKSHPLTMAGIVDDDGYCKDQIFFNIDLPPKRFIQLEGLAWSTN
jgi:hypothetical protein